MCWNAPVSFVTLGAGTLLNILSYIALTRRASLVAPLIWAWQYALLMQLPEGIAWIRIESGSIEAESRLALFLNVTQPLSLFLAEKLLNIRFQYAHVSLLMYYLLLLTESQDLWEKSRSIAPADGCEHINLAYWNMSRGVLYVTASLLVMSEIPSTYWAVVNSTIFLASLGLSAAFYNCGMGSMWCWLIWMAGPVLVLADLVKTPLEEMTHPKPNPETVRRVRRTGTLVHHRSSV